MSDSHKYSDEIESKISQLFDSATLNDNGIDLDLVYSNVKYIKDTFIEKCTQETIKKFIKFSLDFIEYSHKTLAHDLKNYDLNSDKYNDVKNRIGKILIIYEFVDAIAKLSAKSLEFCENFHKEESKNGIKVILDFLKDEAIALQLKNKIKENFFINLFRYLLNCYVSALFSLSRVYNKYKEKWDSSNVLTCLIDLIKNNENKKNNLKMIMTISNISSAEDYNKISGEFVLLEELTSHVKLFATALYDENVFRSKQFKREFYQIDNDKFEVIKENGGNNLIEVLDTFYKFSLDDNLKSTFYETLKAKESIKLIIKFGNEIEQQYAIKVLNQLCFDKKVLEDLKNDKEFKDILNDVALNKKDTNKNLVKSINRILWLATNNKDNKPIKNKENYQISHIFISYYHENKDSCVKIKTFLESLGYKCWINLNEESHEAIIEAIESSWCFLICITRKYKESNDCRIEAEYALKLKKPLVPLLLQNLNTANGWLSTLSSNDKSMLDLTNYDFNEFLSKLEEELNYIIVPENIIIKSHPWMLPVQETAILEVLEEETKTDTANEDTISLSSMPSIASPLVENKLRFNFEWNEEHVYNWLKSRNINDSIIACFTPCSASLLEQLYITLIEIPEFFHTILRADSKASLKDIVYFASELRLLFK